MRRSFLVRVATMIVGGPLLLVLGMFVGCSPVEHCSQIRTCGDKVLFGCTDVDYSACRYKSSDGHAWSCSGDRLSGGYGGGYSDEYSSLTCNGPSCATAMQEAIDWCYSQSPGTKGTSGEKDASSGAGPAGGSGGAAGRGSGGTASTD